MIQTAWCSWVSVSPILAAFFALLLSLPDVTEIMVLGIAYRIVGFILTTIWHWWNSSNLAQTDFPVYNATGGDTSRTIAAPRLTGIWNLAIDKLLHDPHVQTCYRTLGRSGYEDADLKSWQRALRASPGLSPMVTKYTKRSQQIAATFDPNFPNNIKLDMDLVCALEEAQAGSSLFIWLGDSNVLTYWFQTRRTSYVSRFLSYKQSYMRQPTGSYIAPADTLTSHSDTEVSMERTSATIHLQKHIPVI